MKNIVFYLNFTIKVLLLFRYIKKMQFKLRYLSLIAWTFK